MVKASDYRIVFVTTDTFENAHNISKAIVSEKLAACCTIIQNAYSVYFWKGSIEESKEFLMLIKTSEVNLNKLEKRISELHPYDVPEIISTALDHSSEPYLKWLSETLDQ